MFQLCDSAYESLYAFLANNMIIVPHIDECVPFSPVPHMAVTKVYNTENNQNLLSSGFILSTFPTPDIHEPFIILVAQFMLCLSS